MFLPTVRMWTDRLSRAMQSIRGASPKWDWLNIMSWVPIGILGGVAVAILIGLISLIIAMEKDVPIEEIKSEMARSECMKRGMEEYMTLNPKIETIKRSSFNGMQRGCERALPNPNSLREQLK